MKEEEGGRDGVGTHRNNQLQGIGNQPNWTLNKRGFGTERW